VLGPDVSTPTPDASAVADAVQTLWQQWRMDNSVKGRQTLWSMDRSILVITRHSTERTLALLAGPDYVESKWASELQALEQTHNARIVLTDAQEHPVLGRIEEKLGLYSLRLPSATGLSWISRQSSFDSSPLSSACAAASSRGNNCWTKSGAGTALRQTASWTTTS
jgi:hypothetical protein